VRERARRAARRMLDAEARPAVALPDILTLRERLARPTPLTLWRIERWQPRQSRVIVAAPFKGGKTTLMGSLLRSLVDGDDFLGRDPVTVVSGTVVLLDTEMPDRLLDDWLRDQQIGRDDRIIPIALRGRVAALDLLDADRRAEWAARLRRLEAEYLVIDCFRPLLDVFGLDEHRDAGRLLVAVDELSIEAGIPEACLVHHMGHTGERSRGDSRLRDWPDVEWRIVRQDDDPASARFITAYGRDVDVPESPLLYDTSGRRLTIGHGSRKDEKARRVLVDVLAVLAEHDAELSGRHIKSELKDSEHGKDAIDAALRFGVRERLLVKRDGPKHAYLYRRVRSVRVSECVRPVSEDTSSVSVCPGSLKDPDTRTLSEESTIAKTKHDRDADWDLADARFKAGWR